MIYLSIISPFYNSENKSSRLLETLLQINDIRIEIILVNDGSTDGTLSLLHSFKNRSKIQTTILSQENKGPGGARNSGLKVAEGKYIWFVDSDDDINLQVLDDLIQLTESNFDLIEFDFISNKKSVNSMRLPSGIYSIDSAERKLTPSLMINHTGLICTKLLSRSFLLNNNIFFPEYCIYEDAPILMFIIPFYCSTFIKTEIIGYFHHTEYPSITRSEVSPRSYDRLFTAVEYYKKGLSLAKNETEINLLKERFIAFYLFNTLSGILLKRFPSPYLIPTYRLMKQYRKMAAELGISEDFMLDYLQTRGKKFTLRFLFHWNFSYLTIGDSTKFFEAQRLKAWSRPYHEQISFESDL